MNPDKKVLDLLNSMGSNTSKVRPVYFYFYFPNEKVAKTFALRLQGMNFNVKVRRSGMGKDWLCLADREMAPDLDLLEGLRKLLTSLAENLHGNYDGWETEMIF